MAADVVLAVHFAVVVFIVGGLCAVWLGAALGWHWVRNPWFRYLHLAAIAFVALEALLGLACPLTVLEDVLRGRTIPESFIARWMQRLIFYRAPAWVFTCVYFAWALATALTLKWLPPTRKAR